MDLSFAMRSALSFDDVPFSKAVFSVGTATGMMPNDKH
jgi:hypothetical protein